MAGSNIGAVVGGLTAAALAVVAYLGYQASAAPERPSAAPPEAGASPSASSRPRVSVGPAAPTPGRTALPAGSGQGERVVYSLRTQRVWLVEAGESVSRTYRVKPSTVNPPPGEYAVTSRSQQVTGSDGVPVEHVVRFTMVGGTVIGFSAAVDGSTADPDPIQKTGGIRESRADGEAMWLFTTVGTKVVVVP